jgi:hypothetical protein
MTRSARSISSWMDGLNFQVSMSNPAFLIVSESRVDAPQSRSRSEFPRCSTTCTNPFVCSAVSTGSETVACRSASNLVEPTVTKTSISPLVTTVEVTLTRISRGRNDEYDSIERTTHHAVPACHPQQIIMGYTLCVLGISFPTRNPLSLTTSSRMRDDGCRHHIWRHRQSPIQGQHACPPQVGVPYTWHIYPNRRFSRSLAAFAFHCHRHEAGECKKAPAYVWPPRRARLVCRNPRRRKSHSCSPI